MRTAIIFYSLDGNSALVTETIKSAINADVFEIKTRGSGEGTGIAKFFWCCGLMFKGKNVSIVPPALNIEEYELIILGTPVWAWAPAPPMLSFLNKTKIKGKKIALFCCHGGGMGKAFEKFKALLPGNTFTGEIDFKNAATDGRAALKQKIDEWVKKVIS